MSHEASCDVPTGDHWEQWLREGMLVFDTIYNPENTLLLKLARQRGCRAVSGLEMTQNSMRLSWSREEVDQRLHEIMVNIHQSCVDTAESYGTPGNYVNGANIAGFLKVANAMMDQGLV